MDASPTPEPPVRAFDAELVNRLENGICGIWEARQVQGLLAWMDIYERALRRIAVYGDADSAMLAARVMAGDYDAVD